MITESLVGKELVCHVTGKKFIGAIDGITTNYARDSKGNIYSDEGVNITELEEIKNRSKPFTAYLSGDGKHITGWKGNELMRTIYAYKSNAGFTGWHKDGGQTIVRAIDNQGFEWYGRNAGKGMIITLRPAKHKTK